MRKPFRMPTFRRVATAYCIDELADWAVMIALAIFVFDRTGDALATSALFLAAKFVPGVAVTFLAARFDRIALMRGMAAVYAAAALSLVGLVLLTAVGAVAAAIALSAVFGTLAALGRTMSRTAVVAILEPRGLLREGNAALNVGFAVSSTAGPALAGGLVALTDVPTVIGLGAALFACQAAVLGLAPAVERAPAGGDDTEPSTGRVRAVLAYVNANPALRVLIGGQLLAFALFMVVAPLEVVLAKDTLGAGDAGYGALAASWGLGMVAGSAIFAATRGASVWFAAGWSTTAMAVGYLGMGLSPDIVAACAASALGGIGNGVQWVAVLTAVQEQTAARFQQRVAGLLEASLTIAPGIGFPLGGLLAALWSPRVAFVASGTAVLALIALAALMLRTARSAPAPHPEPVTG